MSNCETHPRECEQPLSKAAAVPILNSDENGSSVLDEHALAEILKNVADKKVAIISVAGAFREGKSFLLNFFVHYLETMENNNNNKEDVDWFNSETLLNKFHWSSGTAVDTHGILMWNHPFILEDENGDKIVVRLMDTQGTFDHSSSLRKCTTIFALSTILSSVQIFNVSRNIQEDDLQNLELFTEFAKLARKTGDAAPFQTLLFLVRDWPNSNQYEYGFDGGQRFLDDVLDVQQTLPIRHYPDGSKSNCRPSIPTENVEVRRCLRTSFSKMSCFLMPYPGSKISNNNTQLKVGVLEPEFKRELLKFVPSVIRALPPKLLNGRPIECAQFASLFRKYASVFKGDVLPSPRRILQATIDASHQCALDKAKEAYDKHINVDCQTISSATFQSQHTRAKEAALKVFNTFPKMGNEEIGQAYLKKLHTYIEHRNAELAHLIQQREELEREKREQEEQEELAQRLMFALHLTVNMMHLLQNAILTDVEPR